MTASQQLYVAVVPPPQVIDMIDDLPTRAQRGVRYTKRYRWHITLKFLGDSDTNEALTALGELDASAAEVVLGPAVSLLGKRVVMIPASGLDELAAATTAAFVGVGEPRPGRDFTGHLTLARLKGAPLRDPSTVSVLDAPLAASFRATSVAVFATELTPEGATRTLLAERLLSD